MKTTPNITVEHWEAIYDGLKRERFRAEDAARAAYTCPECGSQDGMWQVWARIVRGQEERFDWYALNGDDENLYSPCFACKRATEVVLARYTALNVAEVVVRVEQWCAD